LKTPATSLTRGFRAADSEN